MRNKDFDLLVDDLNDWLREAEKPCRYIDAFLDGFLSCFSFGLYGSRRVRHPLYGRKDLTGWQIDAVSLASDFVRAKREAINKKQELIKQFGNEQYVQMLQMADEIYMMHKRKFEAHEQSKATDKAIGAKIP